MKAADAPLSPQQALHPEKRRRMLFREVNERIREFAIGSDRLLTDELEILCECGRLDCFEHVAVTLEQFDEARNGGGGFVVVAGHERSDQEQVLTELPVGRVVRSRRMASPLAAARV